MLDYLQGTNSSTMFLAGVEENEVTNIVKSCKNKKSIGYDNVDMVIVKKVISNIVTPVYKAGEKIFFTNYRPVSLLPQFSKILEKIFNVRLDKFIEKYDILSSSQYGFRSSMSTSIALLELIENITTALDQKKMHYWCFY